MKQSSTRGRSKGRAVVILALLSATAFALFIGYQIWSNQSFPVDERPFSQYAAVASATFNGTEYAFTVKWLANDSAPLYAKVTSGTAESPLCTVDAGTPPGGQTLFMPFGLSAPSGSLSDVDLLIAVKSIPTGAQFTIVYHVDSVTATPGNIQPQNLSCAQTSAPM